LGQSKETHVQRIISLIAFVSLALGIATAALDPEAMSLAVPMTRKTPAATASPECPPTDTPPTTLVPTKPRVLDYLRTFAPLAKVDVMQ
jgi:hypothetical protein